MGLKSYGYLVIIQTLKRVYVLFFFFTGEIHFIEETRFDTSIGG